MKLVREEHVGGLAEPVGGPRAVVFRRRWKGLACKREKGGVGGGGYVRSESKAFQPVEVISPSVAARFHAKTAQPLPDSTVRINNATPVFSPQNHTDRNQPSHSRFFSKTPHALNQTHQTIDNPSLPILNHTFAIHPSHPFPQVNRTQSHAPTRAPSVLRGQSLIRTCGATTRPPQDGLVPTRAVSAPGHQIRGDGKRSTSLADKHNGKKSHQYIHIVYPPSPLPTTKRLPAIVKHLPPSAHRNNTSVRSAVK